MFASNSGATFTFAEEQVCPACGGRFNAAERHKQYAPVIVIACPCCAKLLWLPGLDGKSLYVFDPDADAGGL
jgi:hypothetical protein